MLVNVIYKNQNPITAGRENNNWKWNIFAVATDSLSQPDQLETMRDYFNCVNLHDLNASDKPTGMDPNTRQLNTTQSLATMTYLQALPVAVLVRYTQQVY